jgi:type II secretory pathway pseudopilin PulG
MLLGLIVAMAIILIMLSVAASRTAFELRREREVEAARRADQYVRAVRRFYLKNKHYPGSIEQLDNTNQVRYLRQRYVDPLTGKADWRLIAVGQNKTTVKGFFGEALAGIAGPGLGAAAGMQSTGVGGALASNGVGAAGAQGLGAAVAGATGAATGPTSATDTSGGAGGTAAAGGAAAAGGLGSAAGLASQTSSGGFGGGSGPIMGVGSSAMGDSILEPNEQTTYQTWEFLYDPRTEALRAKAGLGGGPGSVGASALGQPMGTPGSTSPFGSASPTNSTTAPANTTGSFGSGSNNSSQP